MLNKMGNLVNASVDSVRATVLIGSSTCPGFGLCAEIFDSPAETGWPISFLSYLAIPINVTDSCSTATTFNSSCTKCLAQKTVYDYVNWVLTSPNAESVLNSQSFASMPEYVVELIGVEILSTMGCAGKDGVHVRASAWPVDMDAFRIVGGGSAVQAAVHNALANAFNIDTSVSISFASAETGTQQLADGTIDFEIRNSPFDPAALAVPAQAARLRMLPVMAAAVVPVYNLFKYQLEPLVLSREALAGLYLGTITSWADPAIVSLNPGAALPMQAPVRYVISDDSGATGAPAAFLESIRSFANLSAGALPSPTVPPSQQVWPAQAALPAGVVCGDLPCAQLTCLPGSYYSVESNACARCPAGTYSGTAGSLSCTSCPPGAYSSLVGAQSCSKCSDTGYQPATGSTACLTCPANTRRYGVVPVGAVAPAVVGSDAGECLCLPGFWLPASVNSSTAAGQPCDVCPEGATCAGFDGTAQTIPTSQEGFWGDPAYPSAFFECDVGRCSANYQCYAGWAGRLCGYPAPGNFVAAGEVWSCGAAAQAVVVALTALEVAVWVLSVNLACSQYHSLAVDMIMLQAGPPPPKLQSVDAILVLLAKTPFDSYRNKAYGELRNLRLFVLDRRQGTSPSSSCGGTPAWTSSSRWPPWSTSRWATSASSASIRPLGTR